jgi:ABC-2 type transport system ATP-binding protein
MQEEFLALVGEERDRGATVFLSSHELDEVERVCDRVGIVRDGRLIAQERVGDLVGRMQRRISVEFADPTDVSDLRSSPGVSDMSVNGSRVTFTTAAGDLDEVLKAIARHRVLDLDIAHPTLEEVFLTYYEGDPP